MKKYIILLSTAIILSGCAYLGEYIEVKNNDPAKGTETSTYAYSISTDYKLNEVKESNVGSVMIKVQDSAVVHTTRNVDLINYSFNPQQYFELTGLFLKRKLLFAFVIKAKTSTVKFDPETPFKVIGSTKFKGTEYYVVSDDKSEYKFLVTTDGIFVSDKFIIGERHYYLFTDKEMAMVPKEIKFTSFPLSKQNKIDKLQASYKEVSTPDVNYELIYGGKDATGLHIAYREYSRDGVARQAFFQNINYERSAQIIQFQNTRIEVLSADNQKIVFRVLEDNVSNLTKAGNAALPETKTIQLEL